ncbi:MAG: ABC transporter ATP-binding protein [Bacteroidales bacterium]|nr:ABC transporter ATP-binding protein [Bacteroidales bacterium]
MIEIKNLDFGYKATPVLKNINLSIREGAIYGLLGENGVGKTTLLKLICGLLPTDAGTVEVDGATAFDREPDMLQNIFLLPDEVRLPYSGTPIRYVGEMAPFYPNYSEDDFRHLMQELEVEPERKFREMSFGQQKKSLLACALSLNTKYVLLDEPTNGLDIPSKSQLRSILTQRIGGESTIIISTHQVKDVENLIDPIIILSNNDVLLNATIEEISRKFFFEYGGVANPEALFSEQLPGGYTNVTINTSGEESQPNIEALFNAVLHNKKRVKELMNQ